MVPDLPEDIDRFLNKALAKEPADRYESMAEFASLLEKLAAGKKLSLKEAPPLPELERTAVRIKLPRPKGKLKIPAWALPAGILGLLLVGALLIFGLVFKFKIPSAPAGSQLGTLSELQGVVQVEEGGSTKAARRGSLVARSSITLLKTEEGTTRLGLTDGTTLYLDRNSAVQFDQGSSSTENEPASLSLAYGRALVINNTKQDLPPTHLTLGEDTFITGLGAVMGLESQQAGGFPQDIDCFVGSCTVVRNGKTVELSAGQHLQIGTGGIAMAPDISRNASWLGLGGAFVPTPLATATMLPSVTTIVIQGPTSTSLPPAGQSTSTMLPSATRRASATFTITITPSITNTPTPTVTNTFVPTRPKPSKTSSPTEPPPPPPKDTDTPVPPPPAPTATPFPTYTEPPPPTETPLPTYTEPAPQ
jgi:hypothetical protein